MTGKEGVVIGVEAVVTRGEGVVTGEEGVGKVGDSRRGGVSGVEG